MKLSIDSNKTYQQFKGIGASGAWWAQVVGKWTATEPDGTLTKDKIASLLYSKEDGIGMHIYRYNLGGGSAQSGNGNYWNEDRRAESFDAGEGKYDFTADEGAVYMMRKSVEMGADEVIFFVNSPIERLTKNHWSHVDKKETGRCNLPKKNVAPFCNYVLDVTEHFKNEGLPIKYISPINEPVWVWNGGQEGCHYMPRFAGKIMRHFAIELKKREGLKGVKLSGLENGDIRWLNKCYTRNLMKYKETREMIDAVDIHSYFLHPIKPFLSDRLAYMRRFRKFVERKYPDKGIVMSEWCHMQGGRDKTMASGMVTANTMVDDMTIMNAMSWQHWIACSPVDYCDGLIYVDYEKQTYDMTKRYYVTGNFSKYIPLGAVRVEASTDDADIKAISFTKGDKIITVLVNNSDSPKDYIPETDIKIAVTDKNNDLAERECKAGSAVTITPQSVTTIIYEV
ncbi:MAG: hypothetical protein MJ121_04365 [Clostridia bacterium]|nr:hypothetical protein [Clostridia bacterium]